MSSNKKKDNKNKQKTKNKGENKPIKSVNSSKDVPSVPQPFNTSDPSFLETMEQLVSNDKEIREKAAQKTKEYMKESYTNTEELYEKISRSLFYFYWNTDKSAYQLAMAKLIASFIFMDEDDKTKLIPKHKLWITTFLSEISNKFQKIDVLRLDKYIMMCDQVISTYLVACLENKFYKSILNLVKYFIKEIENNNNFNFTFESNKIKVMSRFVKLLLQENLDDKNELKNKEDYLNDEENGFIMFYKKLLMLYMTIKDKREIKNFTENIFDMLIKELVDNKKENKNNNIINKIKEKSESFLKENKPQLNGPKILAMQYFINKLKDEKFQKPIKEDNNVVDPVNDYIMKKNYMAKFKKSKEEIKKERLLEKEKKKELKNKQKEKEKEKIKEKENEDEEEKKENLEKSDKKEKKDEKKENRKNSDKKDKKEKLSKLEDISKELDFENIKVEKELINLEEEEDKNEENEKENKKDNNKDNNKENKLENKKEKKDKKDNKKQNENKKKEKEKEKENKINKEDKKSKDKKKEIKNKEKNSSDDESLIEDSDEDEELLEENDYDDDDDSENNNNDKMEKNKKLKEKLNLGKEEEDLENSEEDEVDNEKDMMEEDDLEDEEYEVNVDDLEDYGNNLNLMANSYSDKNTLKNTQINMKQGLLNKKTQRNFYRNNVDKNKKKKISFSMENNVVSIYNNKVPISLASKKKNVFDQGGTKKQSLLKKNK